MTEKPLPILSTVLVAIILGGYLLNTTSLAAGQLPANHRLAILLKVLSYDKKLQNRQYNGRIIIGVLYSDSDNISKSEKNNIINAIKELKGTKIKGLGVHYTPIAFESEAQLASELNQKHVSVLYVCSQLDAHLSKILSKSEANKTATLTASEQLVKKGLAIAAIEKGGKGKLIINLPAAQKQGLALESSVLKIATVLK